MRWIPGRIALPLLLLVSTSLRAQQDRITAAIDPTQVVPLHGSLRPAMLLGTDSGRVDGSFPLPAMTLFLKSSFRQRAELQRLLDEQQNPRSPQYHRWLTPDQFANRFGASPNDTAAMVAWLQAQGFIAGKVAHSRSWIAFSGNARQVENAFHTEIHRYIYAGKNHFANATGLSMPAAVANVVGGIGGLDDFAFDQPETTNGSVHTLAPGDLATIYHIAPVYQSGIDGAGQKIAVMGASDFDASALADVANFRSMFNLPPNVPQLVLVTDYPDPGVTGSYNEAHLDIEWAGAVARNAQIIFVYSLTFLLAVQYTVDNNLAPVITMSANAGCEAQNTAASMSFYQALAQQANAQGITWVNSGSDAGPASCDPNGAPIAVSGLGVRFPASIPEVTAVGGTEFNEQGGDYWSSTNLAGDASALSYIPEMVWNDSALLGALWAGGGGVSTVFPKPSWQAGPGVPNDNARDVPDLALAASFSHDGYNVVRDGALTTTGGTSASAPVFAGILALVNQYLVSNGIQSQPGLGNVNPMLYQLAPAANGAFHDITVGNNIVPCVVGTLDCPNGSMGFYATPGYDLASGLGSVDVANLLSSWGAQRAASPASPSILNGGIVNAASYAVSNGAGAAVAPGSLVTIFTSQLATQTASFMGSSLPPALSGVSVTFNGIAAPMVAVGPSGANPYVSAQVPFEVLPSGQTSGSVPVAITVNGETSTAIQASIVSSAPGIFTIPPTGQGNAILVFLNPQTNAPTVAGPAGASLGYPSAPIPRGTSGFFYVTGLGAMTPSVADGSGTCLTADGLCEANAQPTVFVGGVPAQVAFAGQAPGFPGVTQINITVPQNAPTGSAVSLTVKSADGTVTSNTATVAVQ
jgi:uncharacterized protein (TIGR03437 family)